jgi:methionine aminopeptidase
MLELLSRSLSKQSFLSSQQKWSEKDYQGFLAAQELALSGAQYIGSLIQPGWSEKQTASLFESYLRDYGVKAFFHRPFVWFGKRTLFAGIQTYKDFMPTNLKVNEGDSIILDAAPIYRGYASDIGYTMSLGENKEVDEAKAFLEELKIEIPELFKSHTGAEIWKAVDQRIKTAGYQNCHKLYPFGVLGHRLYKLSSRFPEVQILRFGWQSIAGLAQHGIFSELLAEFSNSDLNGLWAIEPHIGKGQVGAKFEEILVVTPEKTVWLSDLLSGENEWQKK